MRKSVLKQDGNDVGASDAGQLIARSHRESEPRQDNGRTEQVIEECLESKKAKQPESENMPVSKSVSISRLKDSCRRAQEAARRRSQGQPVSKTRLSKRAASQEHPNSGVENADICEDGNGKDGHSSVVMPEHVDIDVKQQSNSTATSPKKSAAARFRALCKQQGLSVRYSIFKPENQTDTDRELRNTGRGSTVASCSSGSARSTSVSEHAQDESRIKSSSSRMYQAHRSQSVVLKNDEISKCQNSEDAKSGNPQVLQNKAALMSQRRFSTSSRNSKESTAMEMPRRATISGDGVVSQHALRPKSSETGLVPSKPIPMPPGRQKRLKVPKANAEASQTPSARGSFSQTSPEGAPNIMPAADGSDEQARTFHNNELQPKTAHIRLY
eukprot:gnl/MRDRNA2_/MRDRNA2_78066_c0_seq1.p1 gnl/MRDRNA2_/MRDRNA2_78066_c0~~gnl/MRDRNA2_/MRDRNA2_78066_c0_seq1.p1  ORF type:complete len:385 (+),score=72.70 gnl/MRDRNA2_/MRDRNA2_78066_c0_seq1:95-1249(+)